MTGPLSLLNLHRLGLAPVRKPASVLKRQCRQWDKMRTTIWRNITTTQSHCSPNKVLDESWRPVKEKYLRMDIDDKRLQYFVKGNFLDLERIRPWPVYFEHMHVPKTTKKPLYPVNFPINYRVSMGKANIIGLELDAIVNSTSQDMMGTGGELDKLVHLAAGKELTLESMRHHGCAIGEAKLTGGYRLPAKYIMHTVGPRGQNEAQLNACYASCLTLMLYERFKTIAFPCISTVSSNFPSEPAAHIALTAIRRFLDKHREEEIERICIAIHRDEDLVVYKDLMQIYFPLAA